jgi:hypothetical protein
VDYIIIQPARSGDWPPYWKPQGLSDARTTRLTEPRSVIIGDWILAENGKIVALIADGSVPQEAPLTITVFAPYLN